MIKTTLALLICICSGPVFGLELNYFYEKNHSTPQSNREKMLVDHARQSYEKSLKFESKLKNLNFSKKQLHRDPNNPDYTCLKDLKAKPYFHLLNNLCELKEATHLHVGLLAGDSFIAALYGNQSHLKKVVGLDWFQECSEHIFSSNCKPHIDLSQCTIINGECFAIDTSIFSPPIDIYLYDADHSLKAHEKALTYYHNAFADSFIVVIDDWECPWIRKPTFKAFDKLGYKILYQAYIQGPRTYKGGQYVAVIKK